jgi:hypothetical protein
MLHPNLELLDMAATRLTPLLHEVVFVGGSVTTLLVTDPGAAPVRTTIDVDVITEIASVADYRIFSERLRALGFDEDSSEGAPVCRWRHSELILDVIPLDATILGFSNRWYSGALDTAENAALPGGLAVRVVTAPYFLGTKIEAFRGRGREDYFASHDLEDVIAVVDGRAALLEEIKACPEDLRKFIADAVRGFLAEPRFQDALPGYLLPDEANQARIGQLIATLRAMSQLG